MKLTKTIFWIAGIYGLIALIPHYFLEDKIGRDFPPVITHPEYFYGFVGVALAWQIVFFMIARNPQKYKFLILPGILEKASYGIAVVILYLNYRTSAFTLATGIIDLILGLLFLVAYVRIRTNHA